ncbi:MAG: Na+/H+ antiporter subunit D [Phycisphaeraceae bacterium]|nr:Na+/H+ antiporter subunit D [Phycisphaeraceae bacterium]
MTQHQIVLFVVLPMAAGIVTTFLHRYRQAQRWVGAGFLIANMVFAFKALATVAPTGAVLVSQMGNWLAPFGITIAVDTLSALMLTMASIVCFCVFLYCAFQFDRDQQGGFFHPMFHLLIMGVQWSFITGDFFNLFVAFEIMLMASYAIFCVGTSKKQMKQAYKYVLLNLLGSTMFVTCLGLIYGQLGTLNMADITRLAMDDKLPTSSLPVIAMMLLVFGGKTAIFPLWYWLPDTYHTLPSAIGGLFAGLLTKVGAYVMIRVFVMMFGTSTQVTDIIAPILLLTAGITMFLGVLGAVSMHTVRRILSIHIISQVGYMLMGMGLAIASGVAPDIKEMAVAGAIFFIMHNMVVKCCLFLCGGLMVEHAGDDDLEKIGGLLKRAPWLATLFMIAALSLAGLPPLSGFFGKWVLLSAGFQSEHYVVVFFAVLTSLFTLLSMLKIWSYGFWSPAQGKHVDQPKKRPMTIGGMWGIALLVIVALSMGLGAQKYYSMCAMAAKSLIDPTNYVKAVLGEQNTPEYKVVINEPTSQAQPMHHESHEPAANHDSHGH